MNESLNHVPLSSILITGDRIQDKLLPKYGTLAYWRFRSWKNLRNTQMQKVFLFAPKTGLRFSSEKCPPDSGERGASTQNRDPKSYCHQQASLSPPFTTFGLYLSQPIAFSHSPSSNLTQNRLKHLFGSSWRLLVTLKSRLTQWYVFLLLITSSLRIQRVKKNISSQHY